MHIILVCKVHFCLHCCLSYVMNLVKLRICQMHISTFKSLQMQMPLYTHYNIYLELEG